MEQGTDVSAVEAKLRNVAPFGHNAALDTLVAASQELAKDETHRTVLVLVTSASMAGVTADVQALLPKASLKPTYVAIQYIQGPEDTRLQDALEVLVSRTAGFHERVFSTMAIQAQLMKALDNLLSSYRIAWKPGTDPQAGQNRSESQAAQHQTDAGAADFDDLVAGENSRNSRNREIEKSNSRTLE